MMIVMKMLGKFINGIHSLATYLLSIGYMLSIVQWPKGINLKKRGYRKRTHAGHGSISWIYLTS